MSEWLGHFAVQHKLTEHCKSSKKLKNKINKKWSSCMSFHGLIAHFFLIYSKKIFFVILWPHPQPHREVSGPGIESEPQLQPPLQLRQCWILYLSHCSQVLNPLHHSGNSPAHFFSVLSNIPVSGCPTVYLSIRLPRDILVASKSSNYEWSCYACLWAAVCVDISFPHVWVNTKEPDCRIVWHEHI